MKINIIFNTHDSVLSFAANELAIYFKKIDSYTNVYLNDTNNTLYSLHLGVQDCTCSHYLSPIDPLFDDQYHMEFTSKKGLILGTNSRSVLLGTYKLLYLIGCRFLQPGKKYESIPSLDLSSTLLNLNINTSYTSSLRHRGVCIEGSNSIENVLDFIDWLPKLGYNCFFIQFKIPYTFFDRWYNHTLNPLLEKEGFSMGQAEKFNNLINEAMKQRGILQHRVGHGWTCETLGLQDLGWQKNSHQLADDKKDWIALINGKREFFNGVPTNTNLCYSNKDVQEALINGILEYATSHPTCDYLHIWLADEHNNLCECDSCKSTLLSDQYIAILNLLDEKLTQLNLSTKIVFLLYQELLWAPLFEAFKHQERFVLMFAPISRTFEKSYKDCIISDFTPPYTRNKITLPSSLDENLAFLKSWQEKFDGDSFVYDYPLGRAHYGDAGYLAISKIISDDIKTLKTLGLNGYISCQELRVSLPNALPNYIMGLTLFDCEADFDYLVDDYFAHAYSTGHLVCKDYLSKISKLFSCDYFNSIGSRTNELLATRYKEAAIVSQDFLDLLQADTSLEDNYFIKKLSFHANYVTLLSVALHHLAIGDTAKAQEYYLIFAHFIQSHEKDIQESLDVYRVIEVSTKYTGFTLPDYY
ncbi:MAG: DUF4838 domain-containing protein [Clostridium sp.]